MDKRRQRGDQHSIDSMLYFKSTTLKGAVIYRTTYSAMHSYASCLCGGVLGDKLLRSEAEE